MSTSNPQISGDVDVPEQLADELLSIQNIDRVVRITALRCAGDEIFVGVKVSLPAQLPMSHVSVALTLAERRVNRLMPQAKQIFVTPDVFFDDSVTASTSAIVTLSYD